MTMIEKIAILSTSSPRPANDRELVGEATIHDACTLGIKFKTSGYCGGDAGHGGYLEVTLTDENACSMQAAADGVARDTFNAFIGFYGDAEIRSAVRAFEFLATALRNHINDISVIPRLNEPSMDRLTRDLANRLSPKAYAACAHELDNLAHRIGMEQQERDLQKGASHGNS